MRSERRPSRCKIGDRLGVVLDVDEVGAQMRFLVRLIVVEPDQRAAEHDREARASAAYPTATPKSTGSIDQRTPENAKIVMDAFSSMRKNDTVVVVNVRVSSVIR
jgi:hypothetical protein